MILAVRLLTALVLLLPLVQAKTYLVPIEGEIDPALVVFVDRALSRAEAEGAGVVLLVDTPGGRVGAAIEISDRLLAARVPTLAVVKNAFSAGALIAMSAEKLAVLPGSEIGAALPVEYVPGVKYEAADRKVISALKAKFRAVAESRGRPPEIAEAMVDPEIEIEGLTKKGEPLTLSAEEAVKTGIADFKAGSLEEAVRAAGMDPALERVEPGTRVRVARFLTQSTVAGLLLAVGVLGLLVEAASPGFGLAGFVGLAALGLYFLGGYLAGLGGGLELLLFLIGTLLILAEALLIPGFGVAGLGGAAAILASVYLTYGDQTLWVLSVAVIAGGAGLFLVLRYLPRTRTGRALVLESAIAAEAPPEEELRPLLGEVGVAVTPLRPAGAARFGERRVDVVAEGVFVEKGSPVRVVRVEGARVVVRKED